MTTTQRLITDFFVPKKKKLITDFFKKESRAHHKLVPTKPHVYKHKRDYGKVRQFLTTHRDHYDASKTFMGYFYCASSNFTEYQVKTTREHVMMVNNVKTLIPAGRIIAQAKIDSDSALEHVSVDNIFQRQGIGTQLIRFINHCDKQFYVYAGVEHNSRYRLTNEGAKLIQACQRAGILKEEQIILDVPMSPSSTCSYRSRR